MASDPPIVQKLYRKLLTLYPRMFREDLGESMEKTFQDLYREQKLGTNRAKFRFLLWIFTETSIGIFKEHLWLIKEGDRMKSVFANLHAPALISFLLIVPLLILEIVNRRNFDEGFPIPLFIIMWLLPVLSILAVMPIVRNLRMGTTIAVRPIFLLIRVVLSVLLVLMWLGILMDQMPCFLGVSNCD